MKSGVELPLEKDSLFFYIIFNRPELIKLSSSEKGISKGFDVLAWHYCLVKLAILLRIYN